MIPAPSPRTYPSARASKTLQRPSAASTPALHLPRVFHRLPGHLQQQTLLGVHSLRFPRRDAEKLGVELVDLIKEPAPTGSRGRCGGDVPAVRRYLGDGVHALGEQLPKGRGPVSAGEPAADADDRDRLI